MILEQISLWPATHLPLSKLVRECYVQPHLHYHTWIRRIDLTHWPLDDLDEILDKYINRKNKPFTFETAITFTTHNVTKHFIDKSVTTFVV